MEQNFSIYVAKFLHIWGTIRKSNIKKGFHCRIININNFYQKFWPPSGEPPILTDYNLISGVLVTRVGILIVCIVLVIVFQSIKTNDYIDF